MGGVGRGGSSLHSTGVGVPVLDAVAVFGGTVEYIALCLKQAGNERGFYGYATAVIACVLALYRPSDWMARSMMRWRSCSSGLRSSACCSRACGPEAAPLAAVAALGAAWA